MARKPKAKAEDSPEAAPDAPKPRGRPKKARIGHNGPDEDDIRMAVNELMDLKDELDVIKIRLKAKRNGLKQSGFMMHILDRRIKMLSLTPQEQKAEYETDMLYGRAMHQPVGDQLDLFEEREGGEDPEYGERYVFNRGKQAGLAGTGWPDEPPDGTAPEFFKAWADGHEAGSEEVRKAFLRRQQSVAPPTAASIAMQPEEPGEPDEPTAEETELAEIP